MAAPPTPTERALRFASSAELNIAALEVLNEARRSVCVYTRDLEPVLLDTRPLLDALQRVALRGRGAAIRILVQDPTRAMREGHRLVEQARRLSSVYQFRQPQAEDLQYTGAFLVTDQAGFVQRVLADRPDGEGHTRDVARANALLRYFNEVWERSAPPAELRALNL